MVAADPMQQEWPNQRLKILVPCFILLTISTMCVIWRIVYGILQKRRLMVCDYLLIVATFLNIVATSINKGMVDAALGRHINDPSISPEDILRYLYCLWIVSIVNLIGVAFLKWSICSWLLVLNFSKTYEIIVWISIIMVTVLNFIVPTIGNFRCIPLRANWDFRFQGDKKCFAELAPLGLIYTQGISSILTDVVYMAAPLIYLSRVQLTRRTQWGIRTMFLLSIPATICSIFKTIELKSVGTTRDPTWDAVNLDIWSQVELSSGILIASLPPLRKAFDGLFQRIFPSVMRSTHQSSQLGYGRSDHGNHIRLNDMQSRKTTKSGHTHESILDRDDESERAILEDEEEKRIGIVKTTKVTITAESEETSRDSQGSYKQSSDWATSSQSKKSFQRPRSD
ncbi:hypothetical protein P153DRAFT_411551 [Dothidotthia symphoricarpi CBS 119687]|uniref:Rhodopsin domain-containing protein n=1 Tax=Dothidotthia symphoricarpi CBS 119687 TaxID=1392245 RepID=A0A6A6A007_9PLEO|nr:uncharacterized protein P153DRAFT_411551 [Dothidotthia symphoricarpi CBS 119687]KAF2124494.1 hypothetical protein P153DRAFT_411551 [Dothidotthia symphoricarpi CBS 119687]